MKFFNGKATVLALGRAVERITDMGCPDPHRYGYKSSPHNPPLNPFFGSARPKC
ncbi:hypothetical protein SAMN06298226_0583 [Nitrosovibrio sp. Nv4]|nr:hypothetical protein SAMN06298226_0583 [Nitrosovibrio sp. Nv4]